ncbi:MAG: Flp family type IVb pilin [Alphaproteobacteria bacterium HGW-Alphaproteobacteria-18]|nr:MAG: Flp family type IVb pilin [Alphaproteobacteria bacterium HGW-Alphaproteobacteria-18]
MRSIRNCLHRFCADERGATAIEYGMIVALIFIAIVGSVTSMAGENDKVYETIENAIVGV